MTLDEVMDSFRKFDFSWILGENPFMITTLSTNYLTLRIAHRIIKGKRGKSIGKNLALDLLHFGMRVGCRKVFVEALQVLKRNVSVTLAQDLFEIIVAKGIFDPIELIEKAETLPGSESWLRGECVPYWGGRDGLMEFIPKSLLQRELNIFCSKHSLYEIMCRSSDITVMVEYVIDKRRLDPIICNEVELFSLLNVAVHFEYEELYLKIYELLVSIHDVEPFRIPPIFNRRLNPDEVQKALFSGVSPFMTLVAGDGSMTKVHKGILIQNSGFFSTLPQSCSIDEPHELQFCPDWHTLSTFLVCFRTKRSMPENTRREQDMRILIDCVKIADFYLREEKFLLIFLNTLQNFFVAAHTVKLIYESIPVCHNSRKILEIKNSLEKSHLRILANSPLFLCFNADNFLLCLAQCQNEELKDKIYDIWTTHNEIALRGNETLACNSAMAFLLEGCAIEEIPVYLATQEKKFPCLYRLTRDWITKLKKVYNEMLGEELNSLGVVKNFNGSLILCDIDLDEGVKININCYNQMYDFHRFCLEIRIDANYMNSSNFNGFWKEPFLYIVNQWLDVYKFDTVTDTFCKVGYRDQQRLKNHVFALNGQIYVLTTPSNNIEIFRFDLQMEKWVGVTEHLAFPLATYPVCVHDRLYFFSSDDWVYYLAPSDSGEFQFNYIEKMSPDLDLKEYVGAHAILDRIFIFTYSNVYILDNNCTMLNTRGIPEVQRGVYELKTVCKWNKIFLVYYQWSIIAVYEYCLESGDLTAVIKWPKLEPQRKIFVFSPL